MPDEESESRTAPAMMGRRVAAPAVSTSGSSPPASASISTNLHSSTSSPPSTSSKKHRRARKKKKTNEVIDLPMGANFSQSAELLHHPTSTSDPSTNTAQPPTAIAGPLQDSHATSNNMSSSSSSLNLGNNRLLTGFKATTQSDNHENSTDASSPGDSREEAIEISSDEEMEEFEGGMVVNLDESVPELTNGSSMGHDIETESEEGEITSMHEDVTYTSNQVRSADLTPSNLRLLDLSPDELEEQLTYGFFHLDRTQVDLNRLVVCLSCMGPGHLSPDCPLLKCSHCEATGHASAFCQTKYRCTHCREVGHTRKECTKDLKVTTTPCDICGAVSHVVQHCPQRHFANVPICGPAKLWISCCICASKSHLVGDCPDAPRDLSVEAWSLRTLDASQITNLSLQTGTRKLEKEAETRGMRPTGLTIKGRSGRHQAGVAQSSSIPDDEQESFLQPSVSRSRKPAIQMGNYETRRPNLPQQSNAERYDRFDAPSFDSHGSNRNRGGNWYNTDSFGRRRSRSPRFDSYRPETRRSPSPQRFDGRAQTDRFSRDAPPTNDYYRPNASGLPQRPPSSSSQSMRRVPAASKTVQLPTRKGSNPNLPAKPPSKPLKSTEHTTPNTNNPSANQKPSSKGGKRKNKRGANQAISQLSDSKDELFVLDDRSAKMFDRKLEAILSMQRPEQQAAPLSRHRYNLRPRNAAAPTMKPTCKKIKGPAVTRGTGLVMEMRARGAESAEQHHSTEEIARDNLRPRKGTSMNNPESKNGNDQGFLDDAAPVLDVHSIGCGSAEQDHLTEEPDKRNTNQGSSSMQSLSRMESLDLQEKTTVNPPEPLQTKDTPDPGGSSPTSHLSAWLELENILRKAQGKGPVFVRRAQHHTVDQLGCQIYAFLVDPAMDVSRAISSNKHAELMKFDALLRIQGQDLSAKAQEELREELERRTRDMRGHTLPQPPPPAFAASIRQGLERAAFEGRRIAMGALPISVTAAGIESFFNAYTVESISMTHDNVTELPTGSAYVDFKSHVDAQHALQSLCSKKFQDKEITLALSRDVQNRVKDDRVVRSATTTSHETFETGLLTLIPELRNLRLKEPNTQRDIDMNDDESSLPSTTVTTRVKLTPKIQFVERPRPKNRPLIKKPVNGRPLSRTRKPCGHAHKGPQAMSKAWNLVDGNIPPLNGLRRSQRKSMPVVIAEIGQPPPSALEGSLAQMSLVDDDRAHYTTPAEVARSLVTTNLGQSVQQDDCKLLHEFFNMQNESRAKANLKPLELKHSADGCLESSIIIDLQISSQCQVTEHHIQAARRWSAREAKRGRNLKKQESKARKREKKAKRAAKLRQKRDARHSMREAEVIVISDDSDADEMTMR